MYVKDLNSKQIEQQHKELVTLVEEMRSLGELMEAIKKTKLYKERLDKIQNRSKTTKEKTNAG